MTHDEVVAEIQARAKRLGILSHYCRNAKTCQGDRGLPDLVLVGPFGGCWVEVKMPGDKLDPGQVIWKHALFAAAQTYYIVGPDDLTRSSSEQGAVNWILGALCVGLVTSLGDYTRSEALNP